MAQTLRFVLGHYLAWGVPIALLFWSVQLFRRRPAPRLSLRMIGIIGLIGSTCAFLALPGADSTELRPENFARGGLIGVFIGEAEGLGLAWRMGMLGSALVLGGVALVSFLLAGDLLLATVFRQSQGTWETWREKRLAASQARLAAEQSDVWKSRLFPPSTGLDESELEPPDPVEAPLAEETPRRRRRKWSLFGQPTAGDLFGNFDPQTGQVVSAADATSLGLPGARVAGAMARPEIWTDMKAESSFTVISSNFT